MKPALADTYLRLKKELEELVQKKVSILGYSFVWWGSRDGRSITERMHFLFTPSFLV